VIYSKLQKNYSVQFANYINILDLIASNEGLKKILTSIFVNEKKTDLLNAFQSHELKDLLDWMNRSFNAKDVDELIINGSQLHSQKLDVSIFVIEWISENRPDLLETIITAKDKFGKSFLFNDNLSTIESYIKILDKIKLRNYLIDLLYLQEPSEMKTFLHDLFGKHSIEDVLSLLKWSVSNLGSESVVHLITLKDKYNQSFLYYKNYRTVADKQLSDLLLFLENEVNIIQSDFKMIFLSPNNANITLKEKILNDTVVEDSRMKFGIFCQKFDDSVKETLPKVQGIGHDNNQIRETSRVHLNGNGISHKPNQSDQKEKAGNASNQPQFVNKQNDLINVDKSKTYEEILTQDNENLTPSLPRDALETMTVIENVERKFDETILSLENSDPVEVSQNNNNNNNDGLNLKDNVPINTEKQLAEVQDVSLPSNTTDSVKKYNRKRKGKK
jgi:hypothetical protein